MAHKSNTALMKEIVASYNPDDARFGEKVNAQLAAHFASLPPSKSKTDPLRLGTQATFYSRLRMSLLDAAGSLELDLKDAKDFNELPPQEQWKQQQAARMTGKPLWLVRAEDVMPKNIQSIAMPRKEADALHQHRADVDNGKLKDEMEEIDADKLIARLCPILEQPKPKWNELAAALLLATGRRTVEILKTGDLYLGKGMDGDGYAAMFDGQAKKSLFDEGPYAIPLLAPYSLVKAGLEKLRSMVDCTEMDTVKVNSQYGRNIQNFLKRVANLTPHSLRTIYAMATYELLKGKKMSLVGYVSRVLGHSNPKNAAYYQRIKVTVTHPFTPNVEPVIEREGWVANSVPEKKRLAGIFELMEHRQRITASAIRATSGGTMPVAQRVISMNQTRVDEWNASL